MRKFLAKYKKEVLIGVIIVFLLILFVKNIFIYYNNKYEKAEIFYSCHNLDDFYFHYVTY